ncbi:NifB/NifX family molybdenum-iron cluster-binding protein [Bacteroides mediterraneensis]|uniref:NifB/NifX family molybdenum-iron cluster-binding protein n=1 Tax=Bacteroides mediterraneensis TaxID=1841856 RepID=A0ABS2EV55_9BACE|nr:NifB/NifX family molybdenum-iron cluster-binding protein [Bacteroides mediterraneensis]MBM6758466.1 NifB/NifX family molybdenum-iron cluster-binding protein [Bacteroides mediterraneensis]
MKKIALPTRNGVVDDHFGHCEFYTIFTVDEENCITRTQVLPSSQGCGCKSDIASKLQADGVTVMLAGNMGAGALAKLSACGITVIRGCQGSVMQVAEDYLAGKIQDSGVECAHHHEGEDHQCAHH